MHQPYKTTFDYSFFRSWCGHWHVVLRVKFSSPGVHLENWSPKPVYGVLFRPVSSVHLRVTLTFWVDLIFSSHSNFTISWLAPVIVAKFRKLAIFRPFRNLSQLQLQRPRMRMPTWFSHALGARHQVSRSTPARLAMRPGISSAAAGVCILCVRVFCIFSFSVPGDGSVRFRHIPGIFLNFWSSNVPRLVLVSAGCHHNDMCAASMGEFMFAWERTAPARYAWEENYFFFYWKMNEFDIVKSTFESEIFAEEQNLYWRLEYFVLMIHKFAIIMKQK